MKNLIALLSVLSMTTTSFAQSAPKIKCWDQTFAYSYLTVYGHSDARFFTIKVSSQDQTFLKEFARTPPTGWGHGEIEVFVQKSECEDGARDFLALKCNMISTLTVRYEEESNDSNIKSEKILSLRSGAIQLSTERQGSSVIFKLTHTMPGEKAVTTTKGFMLDKDGLCPWSVP